MDVLLTCVVGILAVGILVYMLLKKNDIKMTLLILGVILMYVALLMGRKLEVSETTGALLLDPFQVIVDQFTNTLVGPGFVILILGGYSAYMNHIGANKVTVQALTKPISKINLYFNPNCFFDWKFTILGYTQCLKFGNNSISDAIPCFTNSGYVTFECCSDNRYLCNDRTNTTRF
jgi:hypothetical protein